MRDNTPDTPGVIAPPPFIYLCTLTIGLLLSVVFPVAFLPNELRLVLGVPLIGLGILGMISAVRAIRRAGTPVDPYEPTKTIVTDGPYRLTRNPIWNCIVAQRRVGIVAASSSLSDHRSGRDRP